MSSFNENDKSYPASFVVDDVEAFASDVLDIEATADVELAGDVDVVDAQRQIRLDILRIESV